MHHEHAAWKWSMDLENGHSMGMQHKDMDMQR
jgi:hypothetical protein